MTPYRIQEADLQIPSDWRDQTLNLFKLPAGAGGQEASFVISRDVIGAHDSFTDYVATQLASAEQQLPHYKLLQTWDFELNGYAASLVDYIWEREGIELMLRQVFVENGPAILITSLTTTYEDLRHHENAWKKTMHSLTLRPASAERA